MKLSQDLGYFKLDSNVSSQDVKDEKHLESLMRKELLWQLLSTKNRPICFSLVQGHDSPETIEVTFVSQLAATLATQNRLRDDQRTRVGKR